jgi:hypothetical protein
VGEAHRRHHSTVVHGRRGGDAGEGSGKQLPALVKGSGRRPEPGQTLGWWWLDRKNDGKGLSTE